MIDLSERVHPGAGRNQAINIALGEWLFFADDDIYVEGDFFQNFFDLCRFRDEFSVFGGPNLTPPISNRFQELSGHVLTSYFASFYCAQRYRVTEEALDTDDSALTLCNLFVKKSAMGDSRFSDTLVCAEENLLLTELARQRNRFLSHPNLKVFHERRGNFGAFARQISKYGRGRGQLVLQGRVQWFHFVPFVCGLTFLSAFFVPQLKPAVLYLSLLYVLAMLFSTQRIISNHKRTPWEFAEVMLLIMTVHLSYGIGFGRGLVFNCQKIRDVFN